MLIEYTSRRTCIKEKQQKTIASNGEKQNKNKKQNKTKCIATYENVMSH